MRILVLGVGYTGLTLARGLECRLSVDADLTVVNGSPHHLVQHEVHRAIRWPTVADATQVSLDEALNRAEAVIDRVTGVGHDARAVEPIAGDALDYDYCAICLGAQTIYYGIPGLEAHSVPLKRVTNVEIIRTRFFDDCDGGGIAVVGGVGLSGVQVTGELAVLRDEEGARADIVLVERLDAVTPSFDASFRRAVRDELLSGGVEVRTETIVGSVMDVTVEVDTGNTDYDLFAWTGGITGDDAVGGERPTVRAGLRLDRRTSVIGDTARTINADGEPVPASASAVLRKAKTVADNITTQVEFEVGGDKDEFVPRPDPYHFEVPGWVVPAGDDTVTQVGPNVSRGKTTKAMKIIVGAGHFTSVGTISWAIDLVDEELYT